MNHRDGGPSVEEEALFGLSDRAVRRGSRCAPSTASGSPLSWPTSADTHTVRLANNWESPKAPRRPASGGDSCGSEPMRALGSANAVRVEQ